MPCNSCRKCDHCETISEALEQMTLCILIGAVCLIAAIGLKALSLAIGAEAGSWTTAAMWLMLVFGGIGMTGAMIMAIIYAGKRAAKKLTSELTPGKRQAIIALAIGAEIGLLGIALAEIGSHAEFSWSGIFLVATAAVSFAFFIGFINEIWDLNDADAAD